MIVSFSFYTGFLFSSCVQVQSLLQQTFGLNCAALPRREGWNTTKGLWHIRHHLGHIKVIPGQLLQCQPGLVGRDCPNKLSMAPSFSLAFELEEHIIGPSQLWH